MWWIGLALVSNAQTAPDETRDSRNASQCRVAAKIIRDVVLPYARIAGRKVAFDQDQIFKAGPEPSQQRNDKPLPPSADLLSGLARHGQRNAVGSCAEVRSLLAEQDVPFDKRAVDAGRRLKSNLEARAIIYTMSLPAVSEDGKQALFRQTMFCGGRCGLGEIVEVSRRPDGKWMLEQRYALWVS